jgi:hypothetical protein
MVFGFDAFKDLAAFLAQIKGDWFEGERRTIGSVCPMGTLLNGSVVSALPHKRYCAYQPVALCAASSGKSEKQKPIHDVLQPFNQKKLTTTAIDTDMRGVSGCQIDNFLLLKVRYRNNLFVAVKNEASQPRIVTGGHDGPFCSGASWFFAKLAKTRPKGLRQFASSIAKSL